MWSEYDIFLLPDKHNDMQNFKTRNLSTLTQLLQESGAISSQQQLHVEKFESSIMKSLLTPSKDVHNSASRSVRL